MPRHQPVAAGVVVKKPPDGIAAQTVAPPGTDDSCAKLAQVKQSHIIQAEQAIHSGGVLAYPTEAVYGLGCNPLNLNAVLRILQLKRRPVQKGLIVVAADLAQLESLVDFTAVPDMARLGNSWPGPVTWLVPKRSSTPYWLTGDNDTLAVRVSAHPLVQKLCLRTGPLVSTSANPANARPARSVQQVRNYFRQQLDYILPGELGEREFPSEIRDARNGDVIRP